MGDGGTNTLTLTDFIVVTNLPPPLPVADFVADFTNGLAPLTVNFTNRSTDATSFTWDFGDGHSSTDAEPSNTYSNAGTYSVSLTAVGDGGTNMLTLVDLIIVTNLPPPLLVINPASLNFGLILTGATASLSFAITNAGGSILNAVATKDGGPFDLLDAAFNSIPSFAFDLPAPGVTNLTIRFTPTVAGVFSNIVVLASNGGAATISCGVGHRCPGPVAPRAGERRIHLHPRHSE